ncbi:MAG: pilin [Patescibacteria group bacterium]|jgi:hypothetical protein
MPSLKKLSRHLLKISAVALIAAYGFGGAKSVQPVYAETAPACACYCGTPDAGAVKFSAEQDAGACQAFCTSVQKDYLGCFLPGSQNPENDLKCWTQDECAHYATDKMGNITKGTWGGQNEKCARPLSNADVGYCYAPGLPVHLGVPILGTVTVGSFPEYLALVYNFLLPAMSLIAVVMLMIGGLEYVVSGGSSKRVEKAKTRIKNAVVGLLLLFSAYTIANLLDPHLVKFGQLRVPLVKQAVLLDPASSCESLQNYGFEVSPGAGACGEKGVVTSIDNVQDVAKNSNVKVGSECPFFGCDLGRTCLSGADGKGTCVACADVNAVSASSGLSTLSLTEGFVGLAPSEYACSQIQQATDSADPDPKHQYFCSYDANYIHACESAGASEATPYIDCPADSTDAGSTDDPCSFYDTVNILHHQFGEVFYSKSLGSVTGADLSFAAKICEKDPCGVARARNKTCSLYVITNTISTLANIFTANEVNLTSLLDAQCLTTH